FDSARPCRRPAGRRADRGTVARGPHDPEARRADRACLRRLRAAARLLSVRDIIRARVLRGIALKRTPGLHFPGNFLDVSFDRVAREAAHLSLAPGPWCLDAAG